MSKPDLRRLRDVVVHRPKLLLVGINPGLSKVPYDPIKEYAIRLHNPYPVRVAVALTLTSDHDDQKLALEGIALTNLCPRPTRSAAELSPEEIAAGRRTLARKIGKLEPRVVCFVGLSLYQHFFQLPKSGGAGPKPETIAGARVFVVPNPSGLNASFPGFKSKLVWFEALREFVDEAQ